MNLSPLTCLAACLTLSLASAAQSTWYVDWTGPSSPGFGTQAEPYISIQYAIDQPTTLDGDTLLIYPATYNEELVVVNRTLTLRSEMPPSHAVVAGNLFAPCLHVENSTLTLEGLRFTIGSGAGVPPSVADGNGGGIRSIDSELEITRCQFRQNRNAGGVGAGIYTLRGSLSLDDCEFDQNQGLSGGGLFADQTQLTIVGSDFHDNQATAGDGGALAISGAGSADTSISSTTFDDNTATQHGGAIWCQNADNLTLTGGSLTGNSAGSQGGGADLQGAIVALSGVRFQDNSAEHGGGLYIDDAEEFVSITAGCLFLGNTASEDGGGAYVLSRDGASIAASLFRDNQAHRGGGLALGGAFAPLAEVNVQALIDANRGIGSDAEGAGMIVLDGAVRITNATLSGNHANPDIGLGTALGGGLRILANSAVELDTVSITQNVAGNELGFSGGRGGGVSVEAGAQLDAVDCTLTFNVAQHEGGGAHGPGNWVDSTFSGNEAIDGGGVWATASTNLNDCTLLFNEAAGQIKEDAFGRGGGVFGPATLRACDVAQNSASGLNAVGGGAWGAHLVDCTVRQNTVFATPFSSRGQGGGLFGGTALRCNVHDNEVLNFEPLGQGGGAALASLTLCELVGNSASLAGGAYDSALDRCTVTQNSSALAPAGVLAGSVVSSILWDNDGSGGAQGLTATYSAIQGGYPGIGNLDLDPRFWFPFGRDFFLQPTSPCIDTGEPAVMDPDSSRADMGAHPFDATHLGESVTYCTAKLNSSGGSASISFQGTATATGPDDFFVSAGNVLPNKNGLLFWGLAPAAIPFLGGTLCVSPPFLRTNLQNSGPAGVYSFHFSQAYVAQTGFISIFDTVHAQYWFRDNGYAPPNNVGLTGGAAFVWNP